MLGRDVVNGELPKDMKLLGAMVKTSASAMRKDYFRWSRESLVLQNNSTTGTATFVRTGVDSDQRILGSPPACLACQSSNPNLIRWVVEEWACSTRSEKPCRRGTDVCRPRENMDVEHFLSGLYVSRQSCGH